MLLLLRYIRYITIKKEFFMTNSWGVTFEEVEKICESITKEGKRHTVRMIRSELGTGSNSTLLNHLRTWQDQKLDKEAISKNDFILSDTFKEAIFNEIQEHVLKDRKQTEEKLKNYEDRDQASQELIKKAEEKTSKLEADLEKLSQESQKTIQNLQENHVKSTLELQNNQKEIADLNRNLNKKHQKIEQLQIDTTQCKSQLNILENQMKSITSENESLKTNVLSLEKTNAKMEQQKIMLETKLSEKINHYEDQIAKLNKQLQTNNHQLDSTTNSLRKFQLEHMEVHQKLLYEQDRNKILKQSYSKINEDYQKLSKNMDKYKETQELRIEQLLDRLTEIKLYEKSNQGK